MLTLKNYSLFLFDFDGLLVNTEKLHFEAYKKMCAQRGFTLDWSEETYCRAAMYESSGMQEAIYKQFPALFKQEPKWDVLYQEKKFAYMELLNEGKIELMEGAQQLLDRLEKRGLKRCVVTHSPLPQIEKIKESCPILHTIPHWITRECYSQAKPHPECYNLAIKLYATKDDAIIGFEDSPRGLKALSATRAESVLVSSFLNKKHVEPLITKPFHHARSLKELSL